MVRAAGVDGAGPGIVDRSLVESYVALLDGADQAEVRGVLAGAATVDDAWDAVFARVDVTYRPAELNALAVLAARLPRDGRVAARVAAKGLRAVDLGWEVDAGWCYGTWSFSASARSVFCEGAELIIGAALLGCPRAALAAASARCDPDDLRAGDVAAVTGAFEALCADLTDLSGQVVLSHSPAVNAHAFVAYGPPGTVRRWAGVVPAAVARFARFVVPAGPVSVLDGVDRPDQVLATAVALWSPGERTPLADPGLAVEAAKLVLSGPAPLPARSS